MHVSQSIISSDVMERRLIGEICNDYDTVSLCALPHEFYPGSRRYSTGKFICLYPNMIQKPRDHDLVHVQVIERGNGLEPSVYGDL